MDNSKTVREMMEDLKMLRICAIPSCKGLFSITTLSERLTSLHISTEELRKLGRELIQMANMEAENSGLKKEEKT
jgi:hypothetical protein